MKFTLGAALICTLATNVAAFSPQSSFTSGFRLQAQDAAQPPRQTTTLSMMADRRIVVSGMGITSCLGNTLTDVQASLHEAKSGIKVSEDYVEKGMRSQVCGRPELTDVDFKELIPKQSLRFMGNNAKYAYIAMTRAIEDAGLKPEDYECNPRVAGILGQGGTSTGDIYETMEAVNSGKPRWTASFWTLLIRCSCALPLTRTTTST